MSKIIVYEWTNEVIDEHGDIIDQDFAERLQELSETNGGIGIVRDEGDEHALTDRSWAYVKSGKLPEFFSDAYQNETGIKVPKRFHDELEMFLNNKI